jgi:hypothetical protein
VTVVGAGEGVNELMEWREWEVCPVGRTMMGGMLDRKGGDESRGRSERWQREVGQIGAAATRGGPNQSGDDGWGARGVNEEVTWGGVALARGGAGARGANRLGHIQGRSAGWLVLLDRLVHVIDYWSITLGDE